MNMSIVKGYMTVKMSYFSATSAVFVQRLIRTDN